MRDRFHIIANFLLFQVSYVACVLGGAGGLPWLGVGVVFVALGWHLWRAARPEVEVRLVLAAATIGTVFESAVTSTGWVSYPSGMIAPWLAPVWIIALWVLFATTLNLCLNWLKGRLWLALLLGGVGGPLSFFGGSRLQAVTLVEPVAVLVMLAVSWALLMPALVALATHHDGWRTPVASIGAGARLS